MKKQLPDTGKQFEEGDLFAIPLFHASEPDERRFSQKDFIGRPDQFAFMRLISKESAGVLIIEVFRHVGSVESSAEAIERSGRLFPPVAAFPLPMAKGRWLRVASNSGYDKDEQSNYSAIRLVLGTPDQPALWAPDGTRRSISKEEAHLYESYVVWLPQKLEQRILAATGSQPSEVRE